MKVKRWMPLGGAALVAVAVAGSLLLVTGVGSAAPTATKTAGLVSDVGRFNDRSFNQSALEGCKRAQKKLGVKCRALQSNTSSQYVPNLETSARNKDIVTIAVGFLLAGAVNDVSTRYPTNHFGIVDYGVHVPPLHGNANVDGLTFNTNENSYMIGCLAALVVHRQGGRQVVSAVGGIKLPSVDIFIAGFRAGAKKCNKKIKVIYDYSQSFTDASKCKAKAESQIAQGSQVVFQVAGGCGQGALAAAKEKHKWGIGVDKDQGYLGSYILTSAVKRVDNAVYLTIKSAKAGKFKGGKDLVFNLKNHGVALGKISSKCHCAAFVKRVKGLGKQIIAGKIHPPKTL